MSAEEKTRITVDIFGTNYKLVGKTSVSYMKMVAAHVNDQMYHLSTALPQLDSSKIAVLASVNIADEFFKLRKELEDSQDDLNRINEQEDKYRRLIEQYNELDQLNKTHEIKHAQAGEQRRDLELELAGLQAELQAAQQQHQAQQEHLQAIELQLSQAHYEQERLRETQAERQHLQSSLEHSERQRLQEENMELRQELERERERWSNQQSQDQNIVQDYKKLLNEYEKLKKEYNEWIELVMEKEEPS
jgi:cell division protein ZapA (FtsZ GTPase activity inhibitor)